MKRRISVIPTKAGIQVSPILKNSLDSAFHRSDDFLQDQQIWNLEDLRLSASKNKAPEAVNKESN
jgi:hypothetical protein